MVDGEIQNTGMAVKEASKCSANTAHDQRIGGFHLCHLEEGHEGQHQCWCGELFTLPSDVGVKSYNVQGWFTIHARSLKEADQIAANLVTLTGMQWTHFETELTP